MQYEKTFRFGGGKPRVYNYVTVRRSFEIYCDGIGYNCRAGKCDHIKKVLKKINPIYKRGLK